MSGTPAPRVRVYTRPGCHLCERALTVVAAVCAELEEQWEEIDVSSDPALVERYHDEIPVTLVDGAQHDFWRVDPDRLRAALRAGDAASAAPPADAAGRTRWRWSRRRGAARPR